MANDEKTQQTATPVPVSRGIGKRIYELRQAKSLSQAHIAQRLDLSRAAITQWENRVTYGQRRLVSGPEDAAITQWENGVTYPSLETIESLAILLGTTPWYLAFGHGTEVNSISVMQIPWMNYDSSEIGEEVSMVTVPRPVVNGWRINDLRQLVAVSINDNTTEGLPSDLAIVDRSNTQAGFNVKVAARIGDQVQIVNLSHTPGSDEYRIAMNNDTFTMATQHVTIIGRVVGKIARA